MLLGQFIINYIKKLIINHHFISCKSKDTEPYYHICPKCIDSLIVMKSLKNICPLCHSTWIEKDVCQNCFNKSPLWQNIHTIYSYKNNHIKQLLHLYKFKDSSLAEHDLIALIKPHISLFKDYHFIITPCSIPTYKRLGYNPVTRIIQKLDLEFSESLSKNQQFTTKHLKRQERLQPTTTMVFQAEKINTTKKIVIVDDVFTTGSTITQASLALQYHNLMYFDILCFFRS